MATIDAEDLIYHFLDVGFKAVLECPAEFMTDHRVESRSLISGGAELGQDLLLGGVEFGRGIHLLRLSHRRVNMEIGGSNESPIRCRGPFPRASGETAFPRGARIQVTSGDTRGAPHHQAPGRRALGGRTAEGAAVVCGSGRHDRGGGGGQRS